jgi:hypothetical protein
MEGKILNKPPASGGLVDTKGGFPVGEFVKFIPVSGVPAQMSQLMEAVP